MSRDDGGHWLPIHVGLLDDERFMEAGRAREAWVVLYLALDREPDPGWFRDKARVLFLLKKHGVVKPESQMATLEREGWLVSEDDDSPRMTLRRWAYYTGTSARKAVYNRSRGDRSEENKATTGRRKGSTGDGRAPQEPTGDLDETRRDETRNRAQARTREHDGRSLKEIVGSFEDILKPEKEADGSTS